MGNIVKDQVFVDWDTYASLHFKMWEKANRNDPVVSTEVGFFWDEEKSSDMLISWLATGALPTLIDFMKETWIDTKSLLSLLRHWVVQIKEIVVAEVMENVEDNDEEEEEKDKEAQVDDYKEFFKNLLNKNG